MKKSVSSLLLLFASIGTTNASCPPGPDVLQCPAGYTADGTGLACIDINECTANGGACDNNHYCVNSNGGYNCLQCPSGYNAAANGMSCSEAILPPYSWDTLPVFFHSSRGGALWTPAQAAAIARYPLATFDKNMGYSYQNPNVYVDTTTPPACAQINAASGGTTKTFFYLNSLIDYWFYAITEDMQDPANSDWRLKDINGNDKTLVNWNPRFLFNVSNPDMREAWINTCLDAVDAGCGGCFIDRANNFAQTGGVPMTGADSAQYRIDHMATLDELDEKLALRGKFAISMNNAQNKQNRLMAAIQDYAATERCITKLQTLAAPPREIGVQVFAGGFPLLDCVDGDINSMATFLIGMGKNAYYHCNRRVTQSSHLWPAVSDLWLDWLPQYDYPLGEPAGPGVKGADGVWRRSFESGTTAEFDTGSGIGTIMWKEANGNTVVDVGQSSSAITNMNQGCAWTTM